MSVRLVTVATFDVAYKADLAKAALEEAGIDAAVNDREVINMDWLLTPAVGGVKLQVAEEDAERALVVTERYTRPGTMTPPVSDEELERQALAAPTEEEELAALAAKNQTTGTASAEEESHRDRHAARAFWCLLAGVICLPAWAVGMYSLLTATFSSGPLSASGRFSLKVGWFLGALTIIALVLIMARKMAGPN